MPPYETFSIRQRKLQREGLPVSYEYDHLPEGFRAQVFHTLDRTIGRELAGGMIHSARISPYAEPAPRELSAGDVWTSISEEVVRRAGVFELSPGVRSRRDQFKQYLARGTQPTERILDAIEIAFRKLEVLEEAPADCWGRRDVRITPSQALEELNGWFGEHDLGYRFEAGEIIKFSSEFIHAEVVEPALMLLQEAGFKGATDEFLEAHRHYRHGEARDAIADASSAFESTMKAICDKQGWPRSKKDTVAPLVNILIDNGLLPKELEGHYKGLIGAMKSSLPPLRNNYGPHGQGIQPIEIPDFFAAYSLHLAASNIVFLVEAWKALDQAGPR